MAPSCGHFENFKQDLAALRGDESTAVCTGKVYLNTTSIINTSVNTTSIINTSGSLTQKAGC